MMNLSELWKHFRFLQDLECFTEEQRAFLERLLSEEYKAREKKRIAYLLKMSGIRRIKFLSDFDWTFNPKIPRDKIMEFLNTDFLNKPSNLVLIGTAGVGKSHVATALCHEAVLRGYQTVFITLFDFTAKLAKARNVYTFIDHYSKIPLLCLDEIGYVFPTKEQADCIFQIISKRAEVKTTIVTTNLIPSQWGKTFDSVTASAILDRLSMNGRFIIFEGRSYRSKK